LSGPRATLVSNGHQRGVPDPSPAAPPFQPFDYRAAWYPLLPLEDLDPSRPTPVQLLGQRYVIWTPPGGQVQVFRDQCPHRLAPLSEGRVDPESGQLMCSYHGWCFDAQGLCRRIPQASPAQPSERQAAHLAATRLPVQQALGLLWLWPDPSTTDQAAATALPLSSFARAADGFRWSTLVRDLPYDWRTLVENVADPAHVPFAHHGVQGQRQRAVPIPLRMLRESQELLEAEIPSRAIASATRVAFRPPCLLEYRFALPGQRRMGLITYCLPVAPGRSRVVALFSRDWTDPWWRWRPRWWDHITNRNEVLDGDLLMLARIEADLAQRQAAGESTDWRQVYRLPTSADRLVIAFQRWLERHGAPPWPSGLQAAGPATPEQLLDRYHQHTVHCASCRRALVNTQRLQAIAWGLAGFSAAIISLLPSAWRLPLLLLAAVAAAVAAALRWRLEPWFRYRPYDHSRR